MYRGCMSEFSNGQKLCLENEKDCYKCNTSSCNYLQSFQINNPIKSLVLDESDSIVVQNTDSDSADSSGSGDSDESSGNAAYLDTFILALAAVFVQLYGILMEFY